MESVRITVRGVSTEMKERLRISAKLGNHSINGAVLNAIEQYTDEWERSKPEAFGKKKSKGSGYDPLTSLYNAIKNKKP